MTYSDTQLSRLHTKGYQLSSAWLTFATPPEQNEWKSMASGSFMETLAESAQQLQTNGVTGWTALEQASKKPIEQAQARAMFQTKLKANTVRYLSSGHLVAFGYEVPRKLDSKPVAIPADFWTGKVNWNTGSLTFSGIELVDVKVMTIGIRDKVLTEGLDPTTAPAKIGRPSMETHIKTAFDTLNATGEIDPTKSRNFHYAMFAKWFELNCPEAGPLSQKTFYKYFSPLIKELAGAKIL